MPNERAILCGSVTDGSLPFKDPHPIRLRRWGPHRNVNLTIEDVRQAMVKTVPAILRDLIDIAVFVYCADQAVTRGGDGVQDFGDNWRRRFFFRIPVRSPKTWSEKSVVSQLTSTLSFMSEDEYHFEFETLASDPSFESCLKFDSTPYDDLAQEVVMYSGGIDSLGGVVSESMIDKRKILLVNHRSTTKLNRRYRHLLGGLCDRAKGFPPLHIPVRINKKKKLGREYTQRTRSFLYASLGATIASMLGLSRLRFYENGIVSLNLPPSAQVVGARATRTTHPQVLNGFAALVTALTGKPFTVENPFLWKTKTDVVKLVADAGCGDLLKYATSCTHTWETTRQFTHCGTCSQCIDRRFAVLAAGQDANDPAEAYRCDLLTGERAAGTSRTMLAAYLETANEIENMDAIQFFSRYGEASRVLRHIAGNPDATAMQVFDLHRRHAKQVTTVIDNALAKFGPAIRKRELPASCTLRLVYDSGTLGQVSAAAPAPASGRNGAPGNVFRRRGKCWAIRFDGQDEYVYTPDIGFSYLQILVHHPGVQFSASQLDCQVRRQLKGMPKRVASLGEFEDDAPINDGLSGEDVLDAEGRENLTLRLLEVDEELAQQRESTSLDRLERMETLQNERDWIAAELGKSRGFKGRNRKLGDERNRVRNRVCNAIRRALNQIREYDRRLHEHLAKPVLNLGHTISYDPRQGMTWSLSADGTA